MNHTLYLECFGGISGDMTVASLLDLGADKEQLLHSLKSLHVDGYRIEIGRVKKNGLDACDFNVILEQEDYSNSIKKADSSQSCSEINHTSHHHNYGIFQEDNDKNHIHAAEPSNDITQEKTGQFPELIHLGHHSHRNLDDINRIIDSAGITPAARKTAKKIFDIVAKAESKAHGLPIEKVHFHEVGAVDSIIDIVAAAVCLDNLNITNVIVSELYEGSGHIRCQHGILPVPVPAVANIIMDYDLPVHITSVKGELVTPTGAAIAAAIRTKSQLPKDFKIIKIGLGAGKRNYETAGILRAMLIEEPDSPLSSDNIWVLETNLDDCSGEILGNTMNLLFQNRAKDVFYSSIYMKKNRPAYLLTVLCEEMDISKMEEIIFTNTTTIGIRKYTASRSVLKRDLKQVSTPYGTAQVKVCQYQNHTFYYPEYEDVVTLCSKSGDSYQRMYYKIQSIAEELLGGK